MLRNANHMESLEQMSHEISVQYFLKLATKIALLQRFFYLRKKRGGSDFALFQSAIAKWARKNLPAARDRVLAEAAADVPVDASPADRLLTFHQHLEWQLRDQLGRRKSPGRRTSLYRMAEQRVRAAEPGGKSRRGRPAKYTAADELAWFYSVLGVKLRLYWQELWNQLPSSAAAGPAEPASWIPHGIDLVEAQHDQLRGALPTGSLEAALTTLEREARNEGVPPAVLLHRRVATSRAVLDSAALPYVQGTAAALTKRFDRVPDRLEGARRSPIKLG